MSNWEDHPDVRRDEHDRPLSYAQQPKHIRGLINGDWEWPRRTFWQRRRDDWGFWVLLALGIAAISAIRYYSL